MVRRGVIAAASLGVSFGLGALVFQVGDHSAVAAWAASALGLGATSVLMLRFWTPAPLKPQCPQGTGVYPECLCVVKLGAAEVVVKHPDGRSEFLPLAELKEVSIATHESGPEGPALRWVLTGSNGSCSFPQGATGEHAVLRYVHNLPGFDREAVTRAMGSTSNAHFQCWRAGNPAMHTETLAVQFNAAPGPNEATGSTQ